MKRLSVIAFLAALGLLVAGCGGGGGGGGSSVKKPNPGPTPVANCPAGQVCTDSSGFTTATYFIDPVTGAKVSQISKISSSATGSIPPQAPSYVRPKGTATSVSVK